MNKKQREPSRVRQQGTRVTNTNQATDAGLARIQALRHIVTDKQYAKIDGVMVDGFSASAIIAVYDRLTERNQKRYRVMPVGRMADVAFKLLNG